MDSARQSPNRKEVPTIKHRKSGLLGLFPTRKALAGCFAPNLSRGRSGRLAAAAFEESLEGALALDVSYVSYNAGVTSPGAAPRGLAVSLGSAGPSLRHLDLSRMAHLESGGQDAFGKALVSSLARCPSLRTLKLSGNGLRDSGLEMLLSALCPHGEACGPSLEELDLSWNRIRSGNLVARLIVDCGRRLRNLNLEANELGDVAVVALCAGLSLNLKVQTLNLARNTFGDEGLVALANALRHQQFTEPEAGGGTPVGSTPRPSLTRWLVGVHCALEQGGAQSALGRELGLKHLDISSTVVADAGAIALASTLKVAGDAPNLALLTVHGTKIGSRGRAALEEAIRERHSAVTDFAKEAGLAVRGKGPEPEGRMPRLLVVNGLGLEALHSELAANMDDWLESVDAVMGASYSQPGSPEVENAASFMARIEKEETISPSPKTVSGPDSEGRFGMECETPYSEQPLDEPESEASMAEAPSAHHDHGPTEAQTTSPQERLSEGAAVQQTRAPVMELTAAALAVMAAEQEMEAPVLRSMTERTDEVNELRARRIVQQQRQRVEEGTFFTSPASSPEPEQEVDCGASPAGSPASGHLCHVRPSPAADFSDQRSGSKTCCEHLEDAIRRASSRPDVTAPGGGAAAAGVAGTCSPAASRCTSPRLVCEGAPAFSAEAVASASPGAARAAALGAVPAIGNPGTAAAAMAAAAASTKMSARWRMQVTRSSTDPGLESPKDDSMQAGLPFWGQRPPPLLTARLAAEAAGLASVWSAGSGCSSPLSPKASPFSKASIAKEAAAVAAEPAPKAAGKAKGKGPPGPPPMPKASGGQPAQPPQAKGKGKGKGPPGPPPAPKAGGAATAEASPASAAKGEGKGKGKGKGPPPPRAMRSSSIDLGSLAAGDAPEGADAAKGKGKGKGKGKAVKGGPPAPEGGKGGPPAPKGKGKGKEEKAPTEQFRARRNTVSPLCGSAPFHRKIYWKPLELQCMEGTIFDDGELISSAHIDTGALQRMFEGESAKLAAAAAKSSSLMRSVQHKAEGTKILTDNRARNIAIILRRLPVSTKVLSQILLGLEWENEQLRTDQMEQILDAIPTKEEADLLRPHAEPEAAAKLRDVEQMVLPLMEIRRGSARVKLICCARNASAQAETASGPLETLRAACAAINGSEMLKVVMRSAIEIGNYINNGDSNMGAKAITVGSLLQLRDFRMGRMSSLHFLCAQLRLALADKDASEVLERELRPVFDAAKFQIQGISQAVRTFDGDVSMVGTEWKNFADDYGEELNGGDAKEQEFGEQPGCLENALLVRGSPRQRLERLASMVERLSKRLHEDLDATAVQVRETLRFCGVKSSKSTDIPMDFEPFVMQLAEFLRAFRQHWGDVNDDLPRYSAFFTGEDDSP